MDPVTDLAKLIRTLAFELPHDPAGFGVTLDADGFADLDELVVGIRHRDYDWALLTRGDVLGSVC